MDSVLRVNSNQEMHMIGHGFQLNEFGLPFGADFSNDLFQTPVDRTSDDWPPILRAPHYMVSAFIGYIMIVLYRFHT
jgi:hypothetical protein